MIPDFVAEALLDGPQQIFVPLDFQLGVQTALHQDACAAQVDRLLDFVEDHFLGMNVPFGVPHGPVERAEAAVFSAEIGVINVAIDDIADDAMRMKLAAHGIGRRADADQVVALKQIGSFQSRHHTDTFLNSIALGNSAAYCRNNDKPWYSRSPKS